MSLQSLDRTQWSYAEALAHVQTVTVARRATEAAKAPPKPVPAHNHWSPPQDPTIAWKAEAETELLVALRDGDLLAQGRYTEERTHGWGKSAFGLPHQHSTRAVARGQVFLRATDRAGLGVHRHPRAAFPREGDLAGLHPGALMQAAIAKFGITPEDQGKKDCLVDWFLEQQIEGEPVSNKLADAMATLVRLPSAQRGGAKRVLGPDLRQTG